MQTQWQTGRRHSTMRFPSSLLFLPTQQEEPVLGWLVFCHQPGRPFTTLCVQLCVREREVEQHVEPDEASSALMTKLAGPTPRRIQSLVAEVALLGLDPRTMTSRTLTLASCRFCLAGALGWQGC